MWVEAILFKGDLAKVAGEPSLLRLRIDIAKVGVEPRRVGPPQTLLQDLRGRAT
jgi:hypothetical protein